MKNKYIILLFSLILISLESWAQMALSSSDTLNLDEILITGSKKKSINRKDINGKILELQNPHDGGELFINQPGFGIVKKGNYAMEPVLRGFKYRQLNIQFDGGVHSTNACPNRMDPAISQISVEDIQRIEVVYGPYSVRFGPVFGGIINIVSKRPLRGSRAFASSVTSGYQSNGNNFYSDFFTQVVKKRFDFSANIGYKNYGNYKSGSGETIMSSFKRTGYTTRLGYNISDKQRLQFTLRQSFARDVLYAGLPMDADEDNSSILSLDYGVSDISKSVFSLKFKLYGSFITHLMSNKRRPNYKYTHANTPLTAQDIGGRTELGISTGVRNVLYTGIDFRHIGKNGSRTREVFINACTGMVLPQPKTFTDKVWQNSSTNDFGIFLENKYSISKSLTWLTGLRLDEVTYSILDPSNDFKVLYNGDIKPKSRLLPEITTSLTWNLNSSTTLQISSARVSRTPDLSELFINHLSIGADAYEYIGNPGLKAEINYQTDLRLEKDFKNVSLYSDVFVSFLKNYITARVDSSVIRKFMPCKQPKYTKKFTNIGKAFKAGFEVGLNWKMNRYILYDLSASYTYAQNISWNEPLPEIEPFTMVSGIAYNATKFNSRLDVRIAANQNRVSASFNEPKTPGYAVFDWYLNANITKSLEFRISVTNILNRNYVQHLSRAYRNMKSKSLYFEPGRSFNFSLKWNIL